MSATIVAGGLGGHAVAIRIWRRNGLVDNGDRLVAAIGLIVDVGPALFPVTSPFRLRGFLLRLTGLPYG
jgi:hypothetical protein